MAAPTFVAEYETAWTSNPASITQSVTAAVGDRLVLILMGSNGGGTYSTPSGGTGLTWTLEQNVHISTSWSDAWVWTATATTAETFDLTITKTGGTNLWGFNVLRFTNSAGFGNSAKANLSASGGVSLALNTTAANSAIVMAVVDWDPNDGASRVYDTSAGSFTEQTYSFQNPYYTVYGGFYGDVGTAATKTIGMTAPTGQKYSIVALEVLASGGTDATVLAVDAAATAQAEAPAVEGQSEISGGGPATATAMAHAPVVVGFIAGADADVVAVPAAATAQGHAPALTGDASIVAVVATATATTYAPSVLALDAEADAPVYTFAATATAFVHPPTVSGQTSATVAAVTATATARGHVPVVEVFFTFIPPTHEEPMQTKVRPLNYFRLTWATSVVRVNGVFTAVRSPNTDLLNAAGEAGVDYFLGGREYRISAETAAELTAAGFTVL